MADRYSIPWAPTDIYRSDSRLPEMIMRRGSLAAERQLRSGDIWANAVAQLGGIASQAFQQRDERKQKEAQTQRLAKQDEAFVSLLSKSPGPPDPREVIRIYGPEKGMKLAEGLVAFGELGQKQGEAALKSLPAMIRGAQAMSEPLRAQIYPILREKTLATGLFPPEAIPEQYDPETWGQVVAFGQSLEAPASPKTRSVQQRMPDGSVVEKIVEDRPGQEFVSAPAAPKPPAPPNTPFEALLPTLGPNPTQEQIIGLQARLAAAGRAPEKPSIGLPPIKERRVNQLADKFAGDPTVKRSNVLGEASAFVQSLGDETENPADDQALIYAFAKAMDPDSAVREGEYATVQKYAQSWADKFKFDARRIISNSEFLTPEARKNIKAAIRSKAAAARTSYENIRKEYAKQIDRVTGGSDGLEYLIDFGAGYGAKGAAPVDLKPDESAFLESYLPGK